MLRNTSQILCCVFLFFITQAASAAPSAALGYTPKYPPDFTHFEYVNPAAPKGGNLILSGFGSFDNINPFLLKGISAEGLYSLDTPTANLLFDTLMEPSLDEPLSVYPLLAQDIALAKDKLSVTFTLNPAARFSDGTPVTAEDVKFSFDTLVSPQAHPLFRIYWSDVQKTEVLDSQRIRFHFAKLNPQLHLLLAKVPVFSKAAVGDRAFDSIVTDALVGSGPYTIEQVKLSKTISYRYNPEYWARELSSRRGMFNFERITYKYYKDRDISLEALKAGEFDYMTVYNSKQWARDFIGKMFDNGDVIKTHFPHQNNSGMQALVFNLRKPMFQDIRVRKAINLAFDFDWTNKNLFFGQYERSDSYFSNSKLASSGLPSEAELAILKPLQVEHPEHFPTTAITEAWQPVSTTTPPHSLRNNLRRAMQLLTEAGWTLKDGVLQNAAGQKLEFEILVLQRPFERIIAPFERNLSKIGVKIRYRTVEIALYKRKLDNFEYDMIVAIFPQNQTPGINLINLWHSNTAEQKGSRNWLGLKNPVVDALIEKIIAAAQDREQLLTLVHALDRVLLHGYYVVPNWHISTHRVAYWNKFGHPERLPHHYYMQDWVPRIWWLRPLQPQEVLNDDS